ncbi:MAG: cupin domain-containing protein [Pseudomonadota bacterium]|nr:cupin domain-containing protein [Pseudomonadota bacterium]
MKPKLNPNGTASETMTSLNSIRIPAHAARALLVAGLLGLGPVASAQAGEEASGIRHTPVTSQVLPKDPGRSLTAVVVELAPEAKSSSHHHAGTVFAYVLEGTVRSQLDGGKVIDYRAGQTWVEPPGTEHTLTENPSKTMPARLLAVFIAPTGAPLKTK